MSTKKQRAEAARKVVELVESYDWIVGSEPKWSVPTSAGEMTVALWRNHDCNAIFLRFKDPTLAKATFGLSGDWTSSFNPYSGKWNIHTDTAEQALEILRQRLNRVTGENR